MMLRFVDPLKLKTKRVVFEETYFARDPGTLEQLKELSSCRRVIEESINNRSMTTNAVAREMSGGVTLQCEQDIHKLEKYLPLLENLVHIISLAEDNLQLVRWTRDLKIRWSSALASSILFRCQKFFQIDELLFEANMMLFLYGALLRECAFDVQSTDLVQSSTLFRKAAGVYHTLAQEVIPSLQAYLASERPPEATSSVSSVMSLICLAEAQAVTIKKAEEKGTTGNLLGKLHYGVVQILDEAAAIIHSAHKDFKDISVHLVEFIYLSKVIHELRSYKNLAECLRTDNQIGVALGVLKHTLTSAQKNKQPGKESWRLVVKQEIDSMSELLRKFEHENNFVWNDKVPPHHDLPLPGGKRIVNLIPYNRQRLESPLSFKI